MRRRIQSILVAFTAQKQRQNPECITNPSKLGIVTSLLKNPKIMPEEQQTTKSFNAKTDLTKEQNKTFEFVKNRIVELKETRKDVYGIKLEEIWNDADREYVPHRLKATGSKKIVYLDDEKGWRGPPSILGNTDDWQSDVSQANPYIKIQTALSILVDRNPEGVFSPGSKRFEKTNNLFKQLYQRNWEIAKSKQQLKLFIFNLAKYGWACARTYPLKISRNVKQLVRYNEDNPEQSEYQDKEVVEYNDVFRENLDPWNVWIDDMAKPNNPFTLRDWCFRKVYSKDVFDEEFSSYKNAKYVKIGGNVDDKIGGGVPSGVAGGTIKKKYQDKNLVEVYFYENRLKDSFVVIANDVPVVVEPLPIEDGKGNKKLSLWQTYWTLRHAESPYGVGIYEAMRNDQNLLDRFRNMTIDQLTLAIYKMFFFQGTQSLTETGTIKIRPGYGKQVLNSKDMKFLEVPGPGVEAWKGIEMMKNDVNEVSGITEPLMGTIVGKTAFEIAQAKESALKRLKTPLDNVLEALEEDGYITVYLIQLLYSIPEVYEIADPAKIEAYLNEIKADPDLFEDIMSPGEDGLEQRIGIKAKVFREFPLGLEQDEKGNLKETKETQFFRIKPNLLKWEGIIKIKGESLLTPSKQLDKAMDLELVNIIIPLLVQPPELVLKTAKQILKIYDKDPEDWLPDIWLNPEQAGMGQDQPLFIPAEGAQMPPGGVMPPQTGNIPTQAPTMTTSPNLATRPQGFAGKMVGKFASALRGLGGR